MRGLVIGRFQPLHNGHAAVIKAAQEDCGHVVVAIGSTHAKQSVKDPFSVAERRAMLDAAYPGIEIFEVPDIHDPPNWVDHLLRITGPIDRVYGNDERTVSLFEDEGITVRRPGLQARERLEGKTIRLQMAEGDGAWRKSLPPAVVGLIEAWDAPLRIRRLEMEA